MSPRQFTRPTTAPELRNSKRNAEWIEMHDTQIKGNSDGLSSVEKDMIKLEGAVKILERDNSRVSIGWPALSILAGFIIPLIVVAVSVGDYPKRTEVTAIVVDRTGDVEVSTEREIKRVESTVRADIARLKEQIEELSAELSALTKAQRTNNRRRR